MADKSPKPAKTSKPAPAATDNSSKSAAADNSSRSAAADDETQRKFREALERKQARDKAGHGEDHLGGRALGLSTNDKTKRQFRRKSGG